MTGPRVKRVYQTGETSDHDMERRDERFARMVSLLHENPTSLDINPTCSRDSKIHPNSPELD
ncbi:protein of unknown function [Candidatus Nitrospira inopinata]|uniref:Uncharacterized protein n=1 Tax=Candidatus Nitrospira inopinata TaxID=1715989 RepID=A0A0S4KZY5_9BACT|nr:protein of unknown function [Candidatus Nitrospira inopinata]